MRTLLHVVAAFSAMTALEITSLAAQTPRLEVELEAGPAWQANNEVEIPNDGTATRFSLSDLVGKGAWASGRAYLTLQLSERHGLRLLYAPFSLTGTGSPESPVVFAGATFERDVPVDATYTFNSYRVSYRWRAHEGDSHAAWLGVTAKVRDATISLAQGATASRKDDLGFVPLLHAAAEWRPGAHWHLSLDADGLAGGPGRAIDASFKVGYDLGDRWSIRAGYRTLEGGADVEDVYAFAWLHYGVVSLAWRW